MASQKETCAICTKTVYSTERLVLDGKTDRVVMHKLCFRCKHCNTALKMGNYSSIDGIYYCKPHYTQLFKASGSYDEVAGKESRTRGAVGLNTPTSFVPTEATTDSAAKDKKETPSHIAAKFSGSTGEKCVVCEKRVYATERLPLDTTANTEVLHKQCLKCADCQTVLKMDTYIRIGGSFYCKRHAADHQTSAHHNAPGAMQNTETKEAAAASASESEGEANQTASKFKSAETEKCIVCTKRVYATERLPLDSIGSTDVLHKQCLKCADCQTVLKMDTFIRLEGAFYCKRHAADHQTTSHHNAPGAMQNNETKEAASTTSESDGDAVQTASKFKTAEAEKCVVCQKRVFATERLPLDGTSSTDVLHKQCLKCADCQTVLKMDTFTRIDGAFYCKRHAADHVSVAPRAVPSAGPTSFVPKVEDVPVAASKKESTQPTTKFSVERDICAICSKAVYATEKLMVDDAGAVSKQTLHKTCFKCKTCGSMLTMRTMVSIGDGFYYCRPHKPDIVRAKGAGDMYAAYGTQYGNAGAAGGESTGARLDAEGQFAATTSSDTPSTRVSELVQKREQEPSERKTQASTKDSDDDERTARNDNNAKANDSDVDDKPAARKSDDDDAKPAETKSAESEPSKAADEDKPTREESTSRRTESSKSSESAAPAASTDNDDDEEARRAARRAAREAKKATESSAGDGEDDLAARRAARKAEREAAAAAEQAAAEAAAAEREAKRKEAKAKAEADVKAAEDAAKKAADERAAKRKAAAEEAAAREAAEEAERQAKKAAREAARAAAEDEEAAKKKRSRRKQTDDN